MKLMRYLRLERPATDSWMTYRLPWPMDFSNPEDSEQWVKDNLPGWEEVSGAIDNPDYDDEDEDIPDWEPQERVMPPVAGDEN